MKSFAALASASTDSTCVLLAFDSDGHQRLYGRWHTSRGWSSVEKKQL